MIKTKKLFLLFTSSTAILLALFLAGFRLPEDAQMNKLIAMFERYMQALPQEKVYLHLDKSYYVAGEDIWFKAYAVDARTHQLAALSNVLYVELISPAGQIVTKNIYRLENGLSSGDFELTDSMAAGTYQVRAYTNWMRNLDEDYIFNQSINVGNDQRAETLAATKPNRNKKTETASTDIKPELNVQFFPEGGNLVAGFLGRVGFKAINKSGLGENITGSITDKTGKELFTFKSSHAGIGYFMFQPQPDDTYSAHVKTSNGQTLTFPLPPVQAQGFSLQVNSFFKDKVQVVARQNLTSGSAGEDIALVGQIRGNMFYAAQAKFKGEMVIFNVPKEQIPSGVVQFTLFAKASLTPLCERLAYINKPDNLTLSIKSNKPYYKAREQVKLDITATSPNGQPAAANFSLAVTDAVVQAANSGQNLVTYLLLTSDLRGNIEQPEFYFKDQKPETIQALDNLMLTQGWRRFVWKEILADSIIPPKYYPEKSLSVSGQVNRLLTNKPLPNAEVLFLATGRQRLLMQTKTDDKGRFYLDGLHFDSTITMVVQAKNDKGKQNTTIVLDKPTSPAFSFKAPSPTQTELSPFTAEYIQRLKDQQKIEDAYALGKGTKVLKAVEIKGQRETNNPQSNRIHGTPDRVIKMDDKMAGSYINILQVLQGRVAGLQISGENVSIRGGGTPLFLLDDMPIDLAMLSSINPSSVETIEILKGATAAIYGSRGGNGVIALYSKRGANAFNDTRDPIGIVNNRLQGYAKVREFYAPNYAIKKEEHSLPDKRSTLYWHPNITTDATGKGSVSFYNADEVKNIQVTLEGLSANGLIGSQSTTLGK